MAEVTYPDGIAIFKLIYYSPALLASIYAVHKHGFSRGSGWIFLTIFSVIRIIGAGAQLATINNSHPDTAETIALITAVLGLSPLLLSTLGILARIYYSILKQPWNTMFSLVFLRLIQTPAAVALILCVVGATSANSPAQIESESTVHIGVILFTVVFATLVFMTGGAILARRITRRGEGLLVLAVSLALPFLAVRVLYSLLAAFSHDSDFNPATGSTTIALVMDTLQEMVVVLIYLVAAIKVPPVPVADGDNQRSTSSTFMYRTGRGDFGGTNLGLLSLASAAGQALKGNQYGNHGATDQRRQEGNGHSASRGRER